MTGSKPLFSKILIFRVIGSAENDRSHAEISFRICWWGSWVLVTSEVTRHLNDDSVNSVIPRTFWAFQEPFWPGPGPMGPTVPARDPWVPIGPYNIGPYFRPCSVLWSTGAQVHRYSTVPRHGLNPHSAGWAHDMRRSGKQLSARWW